MTFSTNLNTFDLDAGTDHLDSRIKIKIMRINTSLESTNLEIHVYLMY